MFAKSKCDKCEVNRVSAMSHHLLKKNGDIHCVSQCVALPGIEVASLRPLNRVLKRPDNHEGD